MTVTQETDQNYGPFKGAHTRNPNKIIEEQVAQGKTRHPVWTVGLVVFFVFGGPDPETQL